MGSVRSRRCDDGRIPIRTRESRNPYFLPTRRGGRKVVGIPIYWVPMTKSSRPPSSVLEMETLLQFLNLWFGERRLGQFIPLNHHSVLQSMETY